MGNGVVFILGIVTDVVERGSWRGRGGRRGVVNTGASHVGELGEEIHEEDPMF